MITIERIIDELNEKEYFPYQDNDEGEDYVHCYDAITSKDYKYKIFLEKNPFIGLIITDKELKDGIVYDFSK